MSMFRKLLDRFASPSPAPRGLEQFITGGNGKRVATSKPGAAAKVDEGATRFLILALSLGPEVQSLPESLQSVFAAYAWGVVDALGQANELAVNDSLGIFMRLPDRFVGGGAEKTGRLTAFGPHPDYVNFAQLGGQSVLDFFSGRDPAADSSLRRLLSSLTAKASSSAH